MDGYERDLPTKVKIINTLTDAKFNYVKAVNRVSYLRYLTTSQECTFLETIGTLNYTDVIIPIHKKLFNQYSITFLDERNKKESGLLSTDYFLKNKYLYMSTKGALNYLDAFSSMQDTQKEKNDFEKTWVATNIKDSLYSYDQKYGEELASGTIISLGAGTSEKEIEILKKVIPLCNNKKICYYPLDISFHLLQLSMLKLSHEFQEPDRVEFHPIIADFWDAANYSKKKDLFPENNTTGRVFLLLGNTFGNYREIDLLDQLMQLMELNEVLIVGINILERSDSLEPFKKDSEVNKETELKQQEKLFADYNRPEVIQWLLQPLNYIPWYAGYLQRAKYLKFDFDSSVMKGDDKEKKFITVVPGTIFYAPRINVQPISISSPGSKLNATPSSIRLASTAKYHLSSLIYWFENSYRFGDFYFNVDDSKSEGEGAVLKLIKEKAPKKEEDKVTLAKIQ